jgi:hypothetical protein
MVRQMSNQFRLYQHAHEAKQTPDGDEKAARNRDWADSGFAALSQHKGAAYAQYLNRTRPAPNSPSMKGKSDG